jgi:hypothetical protein
MRVDQRNGTGRNYQASCYVVDRWWFQASTAALMQFNGVVAGPAGFPNALQFQSLSAHTIVAADQFSVSTYLEGDSISDFNFGVAAAATVTLSFWARSSKTGSFSGALVNNGSTRSYPFSFSLPTANTWTAISVTIVGDKAGTWTMSGNSWQLAVVFDLGCGTTYRAAAAAWRAGNYAGVTGAQTLTNTLNATFSVTGVKLEMGSTATTFNRYSMAKCLADCQRYYTKMGGDASWAILIQGYVDANNQHSSTVTLPVTMRAPPVLTQYGCNIGSNTVGFYLGTTSFGVQLIASPSSFAGTGTFGTSGGFITLDAEY